MISHLHMGKEGRNAHGYCRGRGARCSALVVGAAIGPALYPRREKSKLTGVAADADRIIAEAQTKEKELLLEAKEESIRIRAQAENEAKELRQEVLRLEQRVSQREENLDRKQEAHRPPRQHARRSASRSIEEARQAIEELQRPAPGRARARLPPHPGRSARRPHDRGRGGDPRRRQPPRAPDRGRGARERRPEGPRDPHRHDPAHRLGGRLRIDRLASCRSRPRT